jgi:hypothetical protein
MNESTIVIIAEAILSNTRVLEKLIDALPVEVKTAVQQKVVNVAQPAPVAPAPAPVVQAVAAPAPAPAMPAPPVFTAPVAPAPAPTPTAPVINAAPAPAVASPSEKAPFTDAKGLIDFVMSAYKALGPQKGAGIQNVLTGLGYQNINDVNPAHYDAMFAGVKALA